MQFKIILMSLIVSLTWGCGSEKKEADYYEPSDNPTTILPIDPITREKPKNPIDGDDRTFAEPPRGDIVASYRQENNNQRELDITQNLDVIFTDKASGQFRLPVIPQGQTTGLVPAFPAALKWNESLQLYETNGVVQRGTSMDNVPLTISLAPDKQSIDVSFAVTLRKGDTIASSYFRDIGLVNYEPDYAMGTLIYIDDENSGWCNRNRGNCNRRPVPCPDRGCNRNPCDNGGCRPIPVPQPEPKPYPTPKPYPCPSPGGCRDGEWPIPPTDPRPTPQQPCEPRPCPNPCQPQCPKPCPEKPDCPKPDCQTCCKCDEDGGSEEGEVKVFVYKFLKID